MHVKLLVGLSKLLVTTVKRYGRRLALAGLLVSLILPLPTHSDTLDCLDAARLVVGGLARIAYAPVPQLSTSRPLYDFPGSDAPIIDQVAPGTPVTVLRGPVCLHKAAMNAPTDDSARDYDFWWQIHTTNGQSGWLAEESANAPAIESWQILVDLVRPIPDGLAVLRINAHGLARWLTGYTTPLPVDGGQSQFPVAESAPLLDAFARDQRLCPQQAHIANMPPGAQLTAFPSPDSTRLLLIRHLWRMAVGCDGTTSARYGLDRLSIIDPYGETIQFDIPAHAPFIALSGNANQPEPFHSEPNQIAAVVWSPDNVQAAVVLRYGHHQQVGVLDTRDGSLTMLDDGFAPHWTIDGTRLSWLRVDPDGQTVNLISATPANSNRQTLSLPNGLWYDDAPISPTWNHDGSRLVVCVRLDGCASVVVIDIVGRRTLPPLAVPLANFSALLWAMNDSVLLWSAPDGLAIQNLDGSTRMLPITRDSGEQIASVRMFPGTATDSLLLVLQNSNGGIRYQILNVQTAATSKVTFSQ